MLILSSMKNLIITSIAAICIFMISCKSNPDGNTNADKVKVRVVRPEKTRISFPVRASGSLSSKAEMKLSFKTGGIIENINADEGQVVTKGQVLAQLNLSEIEPIVQQAALGMEKAKRDLQRAENLYNDSVATLEQLQNARTALDFAGAQLRIAQFNNQYSKIIAPARGKVLKKLAEENEMIAPGYPLFLFSSAESDWVLRSALADIDIVKVQINDSAKIYFDAFPGKEFRAIISEIAKASDPYTGTYEVELRLIDKDPLFVSGLIGKVEIIPSALKDYVTIPLNVIHETHEMEGYIFLVRDTGFVREPVKILNFSDSIAYIENNFPLNEIIISDGAEYLTSGSLIDIVE